MKDHDKRLNALAKAFRPMQVCLPGDCGQRVRLLMKHVMSGAAFDVSVIATTPDFVPPSDVEPCVFRVTASTREMAYELAARNFMSLMQSVNS